MRSILDVGPSLSLPLLRIAEAEAEGSAEVARLAFVCRRFRERLIEEAGGRLLSPVLRLRARSNAEALGRLNPAGLLRVDAVDAPAAFLPGCPLATDLLAFAPSLQRLALQLKWSHLQAAWGETLQQLADVLASPSARARGKPQLRVLELEGLTFPAEGGEALGTLVEAVAEGLRKVSVIFQGTSGSETFDDEALWRGLERATALEELRLAGVRTSWRSCSGLTKVLRACAKSLRCLTVGGQTATALTCPASVLELRAAPGGRTLDVSSEMEDLIAAGGPLQRVQRLAFHDIEVPVELGGPMSAAFGAAAANLMALMEACHRLAPSLLHLDLSGLAAVVKEMMTLGGLPLGPGAFWLIVEACGPLTSLNLSNSGVRMMEAPTMLAAHGFTLAELRLSGCEIEWEQGLRGERARKEFGRCLRSMDQLRVLDLGEIPMCQSMRKPVLELLQQCAPTLRSLTGVFPPVILESGLSSLFSTGTCREGGARSIEMLNVSLPVDFGKPSFAGIAKVIGCSGLTLRQLRLCAPMGDAIGAALMRQLHNAPLELLELDACGIGVNTLQRLGGAVARTRSPWRLKSVSLSGNLLGAEAEHLLVALTRCGELQQVRLQRCGLPPELGAALGRLALCLPPLLSLDVFGNQGLGTLGVRRLVEAALKEWGRIPVNTSRKGVTALDGVIDLRCCGVQDTEAWTPPTKLGRLSLRYT